MNRANLVSLILSLICTIAFMTYGLPHMIEAWSEFNIMWLMIVLMTMVIWLIFLVAFRYFLAVIEVLVRD